MSVLALSPRILINTKPDYGMAPKFGTLLKRIDSVMLFQSANIVGHRGYQHYICHVRPTSCRSHRSVVDEWFLCALRSSETDRTLVVVQLTFLWMLNLNHHGLKACPLVLIAKTNSRTNAARPLSNRASGTAYVQPHPSKSLILCAICIDLSNQIQR